MTNELEDLEQLKYLTMELLKSKKKFIKLSEKRASMSHADNTPKAIENAEANLNWHAMSHDKLTRDLHAVSVDCGISEPRSKDDYGVVTYKPSGWHEYTHQPRVPKCIKGE